MGCQGSWPTTGRQSHTEIRRLNFERIPMDPVDTDTDPGLLGGS